MDHILARKEDIDTYPRIRLVTIWLGMLTIAPFAEYLDMLPYLLEADRKAPTMPLWASLKTFLSRFSKTISRLSSTA
jgi:hypothetical protein